MSGLRTLRVPDGSPVRADRFLAEALPGISRREIQRLLEEGTLLVNGRRLRKGNMLSPGHELTVEGLTPPITSPIAESDLAITVLHEDDAMVAVDKPAGMPSHALRAGDTGTVANFLAAHFPEAPAAGARPLEAGLVHRLDTGTSGVLVAARTPEAWRALRAQFSAQPQDRNQPSFDATLVLGSLRENANSSPSRSDRSARKLYRARVSGSVDRPGEMRLPIGPDPKNPRRSMVFAAPGSGRRPAITRWRPLRRENGETLLEIEIPTGMHHQIRVHLAAAGTPVVGDELYGGPAAPRLWLHAVSIELVHPTLARRLTIESPPPAGLE